MPPYRPEVERFWEKVKKTDDCWHWTGGRCQGYGHFVRTGRVHVRAHRLAYEWCVGPLTPGLVIDHLCRVRHCVNPAHLEEVTHRENIRRGGAPTAIAARRAARTGGCARGHSYAEYPPYVSKDPKGTSRLTCMKCCADRYRAQTANAGLRRRNTARSRYCE